MKRGEMKRALLVTILLSGVAAAQAPAPKFAFADIHVSAKTPNPFARFSPPRKGRYEIHSASMVDLIRTAWNIDADKVVGGPSWLEMDRFDLIAKVPEDITADTANSAPTQNALTPDALRPMLRALLAERFSLVAHQDTRPMPMPVLTAGKSPRLKEADGSGESGCKTQSQAGSEGPSMNGIRLGPDMSMLYVCRNMTMDAFAAMISGGPLGPNPVQNRTGLEGKYNFDVKWSMQILTAIAIPGDSGTRITIQEAVDKQLGLKLEQQAIPMTVVIVDSVNEKPAPNPPGTAEALALPPASKTFEVADVKPSDPGSNNTSMRTETSGRFTAHGQTLRNLIMRAFAGDNLVPSADSIADIPKFADEKRFDIVAKGTPDAMGTFDLLTISPMMRSLLEERFGLKTHTEERTLSAYTLITAKSKMKKADPASRTHCIATNMVQGSPPGTTSLTCQNVTMAQFAERLQNQGQGLNWPVLDSTGLEGGWDFTLTWNRRAGLPGLTLGARGGGDVAPSANGAAVADDPSAGYTIFEAIEKELGLKLEAQKRPEPVIVIDHLEDHPADN